MSRLTWLVFQTLFFIHLGGSSLPVIVPQFTVTGHQEYPLTPGRILFFQCKDMHRLRGQMKNSSVRRETHCLMRLRPTGWFYTVPPCNSEQSRWQRFADRIVSRQRKAGTAKAAACSAGSRDCDGSSQPTAPASWDARPTSSFLLVYLSSSRHVAVASPEGTLVDDKRHFFSAFKLQTEILTLKIVSTNASHFCFWFWRGCKRKYVIFYPRNVWTNKGSHYRIL